MTKHITDRERLLQISLNRKYIELEDRDKIIAQLQRELSCLKLQVAENKNTIYNLCSQISRLVKKQNNE